MKRITLVSPTFNESDNLDELISRVLLALKPFEKQYEFDWIFIDNKSTDNTRELLLRHAASDKRIKLIFNTRNFGHVRSPAYALMQTSGDAVIVFASDLQDPPELFGKFIEQWENGFKIVLAVKNKSEESFIFSAIRNFYYFLIGKLSDVTMIKNATGFGLYDAKIIELFRELNDPYPYFRGIICDFGFPVSQVQFTQPARKRGFTKNNIYTLYDVALLGITSFSKIPLRVATVAGFISSILSLLIALMYLFLKLTFWMEFSLGLAPLIIGLFLFASVQLFFIGILGEYIGAIHTLVQKRPLVVEERRINF